MNALVIPILALVIPIVLGPVALGLRHARLLREREHEERMRALELGRTLPQDESWATPGRICMAIGAGVPVGVFVCAWLATAAVGFREGIWLPAMSVAVTAVISGSILSGKHFAQRAEAERGGSEAFAKQAFDADAYDVVSSRG
jgi:hypothetical protein